MFSNPKYSNGDSTAIEVEREDTSRRILEPTDGELWDNAIAGVYGEIAPFDFDETPFQQEALRREIDAERDRRMLVFTYDIGGTDYDFQMDESSQQLIIASGADSKLFIIFAQTSVPPLVVAGNLRWANPNKDFAWWDIDNTRHLMDAQEMSDFADAAKLFVSTLRDSARTLKDMETVPSDWQTNETYWT